MENLDTNQNLTYRRLMRHILLESLQIGLDDLLSKRLPALQSFANGAANIPLLTMYQNRIADLPKVLLGRPLVDELETTDELHDNLGGGVFYITEAYLRHGNTSPEIIAAAKQIRAELIPALDSLSATYESEASMARLHRDRLTSLKPLLDLFPVVGGTLYDWANEFVTAGEKIDQLLSKRADAKDRAEASALRSDTIGLLNRLRKSLKAEQKANPALPKDLDAQVFGYFDLLESKAADTYAETKRKNKSDTNPNP